MANKDADPIDFILFPNLFHSLILICILPVGSEVKLPRGRHDDVTE